MKRFIGGLLLGGIGLFLTVALFLLRVVFRTSLEHDDGTTPRL